VSVRGDLAALQTNELRATAYLAGATTIDELFVGGTRADGKLQSTWWWNMPAQQGAAGEGARQDEVILGEGAMASNLQLEMLAIKSMMAVAAALGLTETQVWVYQHRMVRKLQTHVGVFTGAHFGWERGPHMFRHRGSMQPASHLNPAT
jgi:hypothetical protein